MNVYLVERILNALKTCEYYRLDNGTSWLEIYFDDLTGIGFISKKMWYSQPESEEKSYFKRADSLIELIKEDVF
jgi:hypothetical protein